MANPFLAEMERGDTSISTPRMSRLGRDPSNVRLLGGRDRIYHCASRCLNTGATPVLVPSSPTAATTHVALKTAFMGASITPARSTIEFSNIALHLRLRASPRASTGWS